MRIENKLQIHWLRYYRQFFYLWYRENCKQRFTSDSQKTSITFGSNSIYIYTYRHPVMHIQILNIATRIYFLKCLLFSMLYRYRKHIHRSSKYYIWITHIYPLYRIRIIELRFHSGVSFPRKLINSMICWCRESIEFP